MLTKETPDTIKARLTIKGQGVENDLLLTYHNRAPADFMAFFENQENLKVPESVPKNDMRAVVANVNASVVLYLVKSFDDGTDEAFPLNRAGLIELEAYWPDALHGIIQGYHKARGVQIEKN